MTEISASTALDRWIAAWLAHQRALGRGYSTEEWILRLLQALSLGFRLPILIKLRSIFGAVRSGTARRRRAATVS
jgi:hypothetical protein